VVDCAAHRALALEVAARAVTLVRDDAHQLPLRLAPEARLAAVVPQPADLTPADTSSYVTPSLAAALRRRHGSVDDFVVPLNPTDADVAALRDQLRQYDLVVIGTINATAHAGQAALVQALRDSGTPVVAVALRLPYDLAAYPAAPTYLCTYSLLESSMEALSDVLWGARPVGGRLPVSIPDLYPLGHGVMVDMA
jgi:beta-N-acetylhexosaminidase